MGGFEPKNKFPEGEIGCQLCSDKFSGHMRLRSLNFIDEKMINKIKFIESCGYNAILINPKNWDKSVGEIISKAINLKGGKGGIDVASA